jgi:hypothetical protein
MAELQRLAAYASDLNGTNASKAVDTS